VGDEGRRMLADQSDTPADLQIVEHFGQADFDPESVKQYRKDDSAMHEALREAVVNALVHADHPPEPARNKKKLAALEMEFLVLRLCEGRWLTSKELADPLIRDAENLQGRILCGMVRRPLLELRFPDVPNRPDQAYRGSQ